MSWVYAAKGLRGVYLSRAEYRDNDWVHWKDFVKANSSFFKPMTMGDMEKLLPGGWLNDSIIHAYGLLCLTVLRPHIVEHVRIIPSLFWLGLSNPESNQEHWKAIIHKRVSEP